MPENVIQLAEKFKAALERQDVQALERIIRAYAGIERRVQDQIKLLLIDIEEKDNLTADAIRRLERYKRMMAEIDDELQKYHNWLGVELHSLGTEMVGRGIEESTAMVLAGDSRIKGVFRALPPEAVERLLGFLDPKGPLYKRLELLPGHVADMVSKTIIDSIAMGRGPRELAREITRSFGVGLSDSLRMARTVQLYSYREATRANFIANNNVVKQWVWFARLDGSVCMSCVAMHGTIHELDEPLDDHHNGRCLMIPVTILSAGNPVEQTGEEWFKGQPEAMQRKLMGPEFHDAWKGGKFELSQLSAEKEDEVYGKMRSVTALKDLIGEATE